MAAKEIRIVLKTIAELSGLARLERYLAKHITAIGVLRTAYQLMARVASIAFRAIGSAIAATKQIMVGLSVATAGSVREFYVWNREAARAWTMMDAGVAEFSSFRREVAKLAPELGVAKSELGKGWYQALSAGVDKNNLINFLRTAAKVSVADGSTIETAIDGITTVLNAFKIDASETQRVTDLMFKTVRNGKTTFGDLASYISQAAPTASALGVGIDQVLGAVATLTKQGVPTATAMVQIRNSMLILNKVLGDGWAKTTSLQDALETVAKKGGYSAKALTKMFGTENVSGVLALVGSNAKMAAGDLAYMRAESGGLDEAFRKVDSQIGHWPRLWQTIRGYVSDVGQAIDTAIRPAINIISKKLEQFRNSTDFTKLVEKIEAKVSSAVASAIAGVNTVIDVISKSTVGGLIAGSVAALVDLAVSLLIAGVHSLSTVVIALAKIAASALTAEIMKIDFPWRDELEAAQKAAGKRIESLTPEQRKSFGAPEELFDGRDRMMSPESKAKFNTDRKNWLSGLSLDKAVSIATASRDGDINAAISDAGNSFRASKDRLGGDAQRIIAGLSKRTGQDVRATYTGNLADANALIQKTKASLAPNEPTAPVDTEKKYTRAAPRNRDEQMKQFADDQTKLRETEEKRKSQEQERQRLLRLDATARMAGMMGSGASPEMQARSASAANEAAGIRKEATAQKLGMSPEAVDKGIASMQKVISETESGWSNMFQMVDKLLEVAKKQSQEISVLNDKIKNLPGK